MPVKVRCPGCEKVLNAPDKVRGKEVRCPKCQTRIKIPALKQRRAVKQAAPESDFGLLDLNIREAEDRQERICPACGEGLAAEELICHSCGVDVVTGQVTQRELKRRRRGGPNPDLYYKEAWSDSWAYMKQHKKLAFRTFGYWIVLSLLLSGCIFMVDYSDKTPPKIFWTVFAVLVAMAFPGWLWSLTLKIVVTTVTKKKLGRISFDMFLNIAHGIKWVLWWTLFSLPATLFALPFLLFNEYAYLGVLLAGNLATLCLVPVAMSHMSMPVTYKAWVSPMLIPIFFRNFAHSLWWTLIFLVVVSVCFSPMIGSIIPYATEFLDTVQNGTTPEVVPAIIISTGIVLSHFLFGFGALILMRATGLFVYYNKQMLQLITSVKEKEYVARSLHEQKDETIMTFEQAGMALLILSALGLAGGAIGATLMDKMTYMRGIGGGVFVAGILLGISGRWAMSRTAFAVSTNWGYMVRFVPFADFVFMIQYFSKAKNAALLQFVSVFYVVVGSVMYFFGVYTAPGVEAKDIVL